MPSRCVKNLRKSIKAKDSAGIWDNMHAYAANNAHVWPIWIGLCVIIVIGIFLLSVAIVMADEACELHLAGTPKSSVIVCVSIGLPCLTIGIIGFMYYAAKYANLIKIMKPDTPEHNVSQSAKHNKSYKSYKSDKSAKRNKLTKRRNSAKSDNGNRTKSNRE